MFSFSLSDCDALGCDVVWSCRAEDVGVCERCERRFGGVVIVVAVKSEVLYCVYIAVACIVCRSLGM